MNVLRAPIPLLGALVAQVVVLAAPPSLTAQESLTPAPGVALASGARVSSPATGIAFTVPEGFGGVFDPAAGGVLLRDAEERLVGVWGVSGASAAELAGAVGEFLVQEGLQLRLRSGPEPSGEADLLTFDAVVEGRGATLIAALRDGASGNALVVAALVADGADGEEPRRLATEVALGAELAAPESSAWADRAAGLRFTTRGADGAYSPGGVGDGAYTSQTTAELALCRDGRYAFQSESESYVSVMGAGSFERTSREEHQGRWSPVSDLAGRAFLALEATDGGAYLWNVEETPEGAVVDGTAYRAEPGPC